MATTVNLYQFEKKLNSTKRPTETSLISASSGEFKEETDMLNPVVRFRFSSESSIKYCNYAYIPAYDRYYFISTWRWMNGFWEAAMTVDALASWKDTIANTTVYALRAAAEYDNGIIDNFYPTAGSSYFTRYYPSSSSSTWTSSISSGYYVVGIINKDANAMGAVSYYVFTPTQFNALCTYLMSDVEWLNIEDISEELTKALYNPFQYISTCMWFPFKPDTGSSITTLSFGYWDIPVSCSRLSAAPYSLNHWYFNVPKHPEAYTAFKYRNMSPYSRYWLYVPPWGEFPLDTTILYDCDLVTALATVDCISGTGELEIILSKTSGSSITVQRSFVTVGVNIQIAQIATDVLGTATSAVSAVTSAVGKALTLDFGGMASSLITGVSSTIESAMPQLSTTGANGFAGAFLDQPELRAQFFVSVDVNPDDFGYPLCKNRKVSALPGYIKCADGHFAGKCTDIERAAINDYFVKGFYYE